jgi:hypothetical protein
MVHRSAQAAHGEDAQNAHRGSRPQRGDMLGNLNEIAKGGPPAEKLKK